MSLEADGQEGLQNKAMRTKQLGRAPKDTTHLGCKMLEK